MNKASEWSTAHVVRVAVESNIPDIPCEAVVTINKMEMAGKPGRNRFSLMIGFQRADCDRPVQFFPAIVRGQGKVETARYTEAVAKAMAEAEEWIANELQASEDKRIADRQAWEQYRNDRSLPMPARTAHPDTVRTGKTERERQKNGKPVAAAGLVNPG